MFSSLHLRHVQLVFCPRNMHFLLLPLGFGCDSLAMANGSQCFWGFFAILFSSHTVPYNITFPAIMLFFHRFPGELTIIHMWPRRLRWRQKQPLQQLWSSNKPGGINDPAQDKDQGLPASPIRWEDKCFNVSTTDLSQTK